MSPRKPPSPISFSISTSCLYLFGIFRSITVVVPAGNSNAGVSVHSAADVENVGGGGGSRNKGVTSSKPGGGRIRAVCIKDTGTRSATPSNLTNAGTGNELSFLFELRKCCTHDASRTHSDACEAPETKLLPETSNKFEPHLLNPGDESNALPTDAVVGALLRMRKFSASGSVNLSISRTATGSEVFSNRTLDEFHCGEFHGVETF